MKIVYQKIKERLNIDVPEIKDIKLYNNQFNNLDQFNIYFPSVFIDLASDEIDYQTTGSTTQWGNTTITIYLAVQYFDENQLDVFDLKDKVYKSLQGLSFENAFTSLNRIKERIDKDFTNMFIFQMDFTTIIKDTIANPDYTQIILTDIVPDVEVSNGTDF